MKTKLSENARRHIGESLTIRWGTSRGRDTYGYTTCSLRNHRGQKVAGCNGGGYDMRGTVIGNWISATFPNELRALKPEQMPEQSHWERAENPKRFCSDAGCRVQHKGERFPHDALACPHCGLETYADQNEGKRVDDGRAFYGLRFHDPNYNAAHAVLEHADGTFTKDDDVGKTLGELHKAGKLVDLEAIRATYKQSSPHATKRHTVPSIDGGCGESSVMEILRAIGLTLEKVHDSGKLDIYIIREYVPTS